MKRRLLIILAALCIGAIGYKVIIYYCTNAYYSNFLNKVWIADEMDKNGYNYSSFCIKSIKNGRIEGKFSTGIVAMPEYYQYSFSPNEYKGNFAGYIEGDIANCQFSDLAGDKGEFKLYFNDENTIKTEINYTDKASVFLNSDMNGTFSFRPYNLNDIPENRVIEKYSTTVDLDSWGRVRLVATQFEAYQWSYPTVFLSNEQGDILYCFDYCQQATEINSLEIKDINGDGRKDIKIVTYFPDDIDIEPLERKYIQLENGLFCSDSLIEENYPKN